MFKAPPVAFSDFLKKKGTQAMMGGIMGFGMGTTSKFVFVFSIIVFVYNNYEAKLTLCTLLPQFRYCTQFLQKVNHCVL